MDEIINQTEMNEAETVESSALSSVVEEPSFDIFTLNDTYEFFKVDISERNYSLETLIADLSTKFTLDKYLYIAMSREFIESHLDLILPSLFGNSEKISYKEYINNYNLKFNNSEEDIEDEYPTVSVEEE